MRSTRRLRLPMTPRRDLLDRDMTKPIVSVAIMMLHEEGKLFPRRSRRHVPAAAQGYEGRRHQDRRHGKETVETRRPSASRPSRICCATRPVFTYGARGNTPVHKMWPAEFGRAATTVHGRRVPRKDRQLPLLHEPGTVWDYSLADGCPRACHRGEYRASLWRRSWQSGSCSRSAWSTRRSRFPTPRRAVTRRFPDDPITGKPQSVLHARTDKPIKFDCGGGCLASTASDYIRFSQMLLNGGVLDGKRLLGKHTVEYMTSDHLGPEVQTNSADAGRVSRRLWLRTRFCRSP